MKTVVIIPVKSKSTRIPGKDFRLLNGLPSYEHFFRKLILDHPLNAVYVDTDSQEVKVCARQMGDEARDKPIETVRVNVLGNTYVLEACQQAGFLHHKPAK